MIAKSVILILLLTLPCWAADLRSVTDSMLAADAVLADTEALAAYPGIMPAEGRVTSEYGFRRDPFTRRIRMHNGLDICNVRGTVIRATGAGVVTYAGWMQGYGLCIEVTSGRLTTLYGHLLTIGVYKGQEVRRGEPIGCMGSTGRSTSTHCHYETRLNGMAVDPRRFIVP